MQVHFRSRGIPDSNLIRLRTERSLRFALGRFAGKVARVRATVEDVNGPKGGPDKRCRLRAVLSRGGDPILAEDLDRESFAAIDRATATLMSGAPPATARSISGSSARPVFTTSARPLRT